MNSNFNMEEHTKYCLAMLQEIAAKYFNHQKSENYAINKIKFISI